MSESREESLVNLTHHILSTAIESGSRYWADFGTYEWSPRISEVGQDIPFRVTPILVREWEVSEGDTRKMTRVSGEMIGQAIFDICEDPSMPEHWRTKMKELIDEPAGADYDAEDADVILQYVMFKDIVYG
ncbi:hypothetical protein UFOVP1537_15 [uncultured Caudovirales phage]|uniref:Uncharacterized protein n=2 Tax=root TaxID=1 RepID=A0A6J5SUH9_9CAUD|nr:hypothetical protein UFOVP825_33 [uncultured Caudovirales phage]CAB4171204.1 hypothetical protein UFOVP915_15 [uncultured Caudovirales phage]CAB4177215.1 hypothetical protein UFOVP1000_32 [uncultured Caudovirales phage]CAB4182535.1 hypothetical protein UFOVP1092_7 [uncultured Caudovirales phage]CAB4187361.1 hypothetical protein UFOVP1152_11 [uncultured Caudovirales phage]